MNETETKKAIEEAEFSSTELKPSPALNESVRAVGLYGILASTLNTVYNMSPFLNRTTRVAPQHELGHFKIESGNLMLGDEVIQPATKEDVHLLCKLLHKHLENVTTTTTTSTTAATTTPEVTIRPTIVSSTTVQPKKEPKPKSTSRPLTGREVFVREPNELNESHQSYLLESMFGYEPNRKHFKNNETLMRFGKVFLLDLLEAGSRRAAARRKAEAGNEYENDEEDGAEVSEEELIVGGHKRHHEHRFKMKLEENFSHATSDKLHLVYWLLERSHSEQKNGTSGAQENKFRVIEEREAAELIDELEHEQIERALNEANLKSVVLIAPFKPNKHNSKNNKHEHEPELHLIDDTLNANQEKSTNNNSNQLDSDNKKNSFQLLLDKLSHSSFLENLHLYLIIFLLVLFCLVLCFTCPLLCFKAKRSDAGPALAPVRRNGKVKRTNRRRPANEEVPTVGGNLKGGLSENESQSARAQQKSPTGNEAIWRKLSNTTTTLVQDQSELILRKDATVKVPVASDQVKSPTRAKEIGKKSQFEWYSFEAPLSDYEKQQEDGEESWQTSQTNDGTGKSGSRKPQSYVVNDKRHFTKSIQTTFRQQPQMTLDESYSESLDGYKDRIEKRSSDTLTKSELVMLKEKMVPIAQQHQQHLRQVASQTSDNLLEPVYVNLASKSVQTGQSLDEEETARERGQEKPRPLDRFVPSFIDSSIESSTDKASTVIEQNKPTTSERMPKMRHLELPARTKSKVEAIKQELSKIEQRDQAQSRRQASSEPIDTSSYRRFEI